MGSEMCIRDSTKRIERGMREDKIERTIYLNLTKRIESSTPLPNLPHRHDGRISQRELKVDNIVTDYGLGDF